MPSKLHGCIGFCTKLYIKLAISLCSFSQFSFPFNFQTANALFLKFGAMASNAMTRTQKFTNLLSAHKTLHCFQRKKSARLENLSKPPQGASKLASFDTVLAVRTLAVTFFFLRRTCSCRLSASLPSHLTPDQLVLSNTVLQPNKKPSGSPVGDVALAVLHAEQDRSSVRPLHALVHASSIPPVELRLSNSYSCGLKFVFR